MSLECWQVVFDTVNTLETFNAYQYRIYNPRVHRRMCGNVKTYRLSYEVGQRESGTINGRSNPEVVGSIPTEVKRFFLYLVWSPDSLY